MPFELMMLLGFSGTVLLTLLPARPETQAGETAMPRVDAARKQEVCRIEETRQTTQVTPPWRTAA